MMGRKREGVKQQNELHTHTDDVQKKTRIKQREDKRQPFVVISITNTHRKTRDRRNDGRKGGDAVGKGARKTKDEE